MGINVVLQDENYNELSPMIFDPAQTFTHSLPDPDDESFSCIRFIDPYGDTIFNRYQAQVMINEWDRLKNTFVETNEEKQWEEIRQLIVRCSEEPHLYLKFIGD